MDLYFVPKLVLNIMNIDNSEKIKFKLQDKHPNQFLFFAYLEGFDNPSANILYKTDPTLANNYHLLHKKLLNNLDKEIFVKTTKKPRFLFPPKTDYYEFPELVPDGRNYSFEELAF